MLRSLLRLATLWLALAGPALSETVTVFAAASLRGALDEVAQGFEAETGHKVTVSYAGSSVLARQIGFGAPVDVFLSANTDWMDWLDGRGAIVADSRIDLLGNDLVLIAAQPLTLADIGAELPKALGADRLAMALVQAVPAGIYGKAALTHLGLWDQIAPQVVQTDNVRAALALVALGEAPFGIVYGSDAIAEPRVHVAARLPKESHPAIIYPAAQVSDRAEATAFMTYLISDTAKTIFDRFGFDPLDTP